MDTLLTHADMDGVTEQTDQVRVRLCEQQTGRLLDVPSIEIVSSGCDGLELLKQGRRTLNGRLITEHGERLTALSHIHRHHIADQLEVLAELSDHLAERVCRLKLERHAAGTSIVARGLNWRALNPGRRCAA